MPWTHFTDWLIARNDNLDHLLRLWEVSGQFPKGQYNALFNSELERLIAQTEQPETKEQLHQVHELDWVGYIARSLRNAGFRDDDIDPLAHEIVVRMLVKPGTLFRGWDGQPIAGRFKVAVRNAILNLVQKRQTRRQKLPAMSLSAGLALPAPAPMSNSLIDSFREFLRDKHGEAAVAVLDHRLNGGETKELIGRPGLETSYKVKQIVQAIKKTAEEFAVDDPEFLRRVRRAMEEERETVSRRFAGKAT